MASMLTGEKREGSARLTQDGESGLSFAYTFHFRVITDDKNTSREEVMLNTPGLPIVGLVYGPLSATCTSMDATRNAENPLMWDVKCEFQTAKEKQKQDPNNQSPDPTTWIPIFRVDSFLTKEKPISTDKTPASAGNVNFGTTGPYKIRNSARQPFETPLTELVTICQFSFTQFEDANLTLQEIMDRNNTVNQTAFAGCSARTLLLNVTGAELGNYGGYYAWRITYQVTYDPDTHDIQLLDVGSCYLDSTSQKPYMDATNTYRIPGNLDGTGGKSTGDATVLTFRTKDELEFSDFIREA